MIKAENEYTRMELSDVSRVTLDANFEDIHRIYLMLYCYGATLKRFQNRKPYWDVFRVGELGCDVLKLVLLLRFFHNQKIFWRRIKPNTKKS